MELEEILLGFGGWIVAALVILIRIRHDKRFREELSRLKGHVVHLIEATERQKEPLHRLVALSRPGSEMRDEAVSALRVASTAVEEVIRAEPELEPEAFTPSPSKEPRDP